MHYTRSPRPEKDYMQLDGLITYMSYVGLSYRQESLL